jgi:uncharacterized protein (DUF924 family)
MTIDDVAVPPRAAQVLDFWFAEPSSPAYGSERPEWFRKDPVFDEAIRTHFGDLVQQARAQGLQEWVRQPASALALLLVCDQFPRNLFRGQADAFALDARALALARDGVARGWDVTLLPVQRWFVYLPFEHAESIVDQREALRLFGLLRNDPQVGGAYEWAVRHFEVIERFGRFPHRNAALGRASTAAEIDFLKQPGSSF